MNKSTADMYGVDIGATLRFGFYSNAQISE
jgi:hypothetical protein